MKWNKRDRAIPPYTHKHLLTPVPHPVKTSLAFKHCTHKSFFSLSLSILAGCHKQKGRLCDCICVCDDKMQHTNCGDVRIAFLIFFSPLHFLLFFPPLEQLLSLQTHCSPHSYSSASLFYMLDWPIKHVTLCSTPVQSSRAGIQTSPLSQPYVVLRLGPPGLLTDFCRALVGWKAWRGPCPGIWPCPPTVVG